MLVKMLKDNRGLTLFMVIFVVAFFLLFVTGGLVFSRLELKKISIRSSRRRSWRWRMPDCITL